MSHPFRRNYLAVATAMAILAGCNDSPTQPIPDEVHVTPSATLVQVGDSVALTASYSFGATTQSGDERVRWTSSDTSATTDWTVTSVAAISRSGIVAAQPTSSTGAKSVVLLDLSKTP